ncbi:GNAT family N-acetyltransferase [Rhodophyticola sp. CCM32]|nr:GNAT family N-acetyltransferase [Rhodophyticola sp. CCM32]
MIIRPCKDTDKQALWRILEPVFRAGDTYTIDPDVSETDAIAYWCGPTHQTFIAEDETGPLGTYFICPNQGGGGAHVCNCGYVTATQSRGKGIARAMLAHSLDLAPRLGYRAMQYNFVVSTNTRAIAIWEQAGFDIIGRLPGAFHHPARGYVDALVMFKTLGAGSSI